ncbi:MAG: hypothetical protein C5B52_06700 [Bacteroidetes bacterium]|nr:MAG: hypothetical protein C5B52_06700 [Bacteroidota bacterium]
MSLIYKTLFEVKLMHEFFLTNKDGSVVFSLANQADRLQFLLNQFTNDRPSINNDLEFAFPDSLASRYAGLKIKLLPGYSGFRVLARVTQKVLADNSIVFEPLIPIPTDFYIRVSDINRSAQEYSNFRISRPLPAVYFFTSLNVPAAKTFPYLTAPVSNFNAASKYEQGELASFGPNDLRQYYKDDTGTDQFESAIGNFFANENDRLIVPINFTYSFIGATNLTQASFVLKDKNGVALKDKNGNDTKKIVASPGNTISRTTLDFSDRINLQTIPNNQFSDLVVYSLVVTGDNGYAQTHTVIFSDAIQDVTEDWAAIVINSAPGNSFDLLAADGFLKKRKNSLGVWEDAPVFEIPIKSRFCFWRYVNDLKSELDIITALNGYVTKIGDVLITNKPRSIALSYFLVANDTNTSTKYLPNPVDYEIRLDDKGRFCFDIVVPESDLFPII